MLQEFLLTAAWIFLPGGIVWFCLKLWAEMRYKRNVLEQWMNASNGIQIEFRYRNTFWCIALSAIYLVYYYFVRAV